MDNENERLTHETFGYQTTKILLRQIQILQEETEKYHKEMRTEEVCQLSEVMSDLLRDYSSLWMTRTDIPSVQAPSGDKDHKAQ